jgi:ferritin
MIFTAASEQYLQMAKVIESPADEFLCFCNFIKRKNELEMARIRKLS